MPSRNPGILKEIIEALGALVILQDQALQRLEDQFQDRLLVVAGTTEQVARFAEQLRLAITTPESEAVLDYIGTEALAGITMEQVEEAINHLFPDRFIEP